MTDERYDKLMEDTGLGLEPEEIREGWHFCEDFDGLLIGPGMMEVDCCKCRNNPFSPLSNDVRGNK